MSFAVSRIFTTGRSLSQEKKKKPLCTLMYSFFFFFFLRYTEKKEHVELLRSSFLSFALFLFCCCYRAALSLIFFTASSCQAEGALSAAAAAVMAAFAVAVAGPLLLPLPLLPSRRRMNSSRTRRPSLAASPEHVCVVPLPRVPRRCRPVPSPPPCRRTPMKLYRDVSPPQGPPSPAASRRRTG